LKVFLTGATGYVGFAVAEALVARGHAVEGLARSAEGAARLRRIGVAPVEGDLGNAAVVARMSRAADAVIHTAFDHSPDRAKAIALDASYHANLVAALGGVGKPLIVTSSAGIFGDTGERPAREDAPTGEAGRAKVERIALDAAPGVRAIVIRLPVIVYGRGGSVFVPMMIEAARRDGVSYCIGAGRNRLSTVHVEAAADLYLRALEHGAAAGAYHAAGAPVSLADLAAAVGRLTGTPIKSIELETALDVWHPVWSRMLAVNNLVDGARAATQLGWSARGFASVLDDVERGSYSANG
jgi:nucleoside-diphosphate-sugar epimerase